MAFSGFVVIVYDNRVNALFSCYSGLLLLATDGGYVKFIPASCFATHSSDVSSPPSAPSSSPTTYVLPQPASMVWSSPAGISDDSHSLSFTHSFSISLSVHLSLPASLTRSLTHSLTHLLTHSPIHRCSSIHPLRHYADCIHVVGGQSKCFHRYKLVGWLSQWI